MRTYITLSIFLSLISLSAPSQDLDISKPTDFKILEVKDKDIIIEFNATVNNATSKGFGVTVKKGEVFQDGKRIGEFKLLRKIKLKKKKKENFKFKAKISLEDDFDLTKAALGAFMGNNLDLRFKGIIKATWFIFWKKFPFDQEQQISLGRFKM